MYFSLQEGRADCESGRYTVLAFNSYLKHLEEITSTSSKSYWSSFWLISEISCFCSPNYILKT